MWESFINWIQNLGGPIALIIIVASLIVYFGGMIIAPIIRSLVGRIGSDDSEDDVRKRQDTLISILKTTLKVVVWATAIFNILRLFNIDLAPLLAGAGILGVAVGFGAQSLVKDFFSGLFIILENQYRVGDIVDLEGSAGTVEEINIRSTTIRDADGNVHFIPNGSIAKVVNKTMDFSKINFTISVQADTDVDELTEIIDKTGEELAKDKKWKDLIISPPKFSAIVNFTNVSLEVRITGKTPPSKQWRVTGEFRKRLLTALKKHKIELAQTPGALAIPHPTRGKK